MFVDRIFISPERGARQLECERISVRAGLGVVGDRNYDVHRHPGQNLTLVEAEEIEQFCSEHGRNLDLSLTRRNLVTRGVRLNDLVNMEFTIGSVDVRGVELCEPCIILAGALGADSATAPATIKRWVGRGGLRVDILSDGEIARGAAVRLRDRAAHAMEPLRSRPATEEDIPFLLALRQQTMSEHLEASGLQLSEAEHLRRVLAAFDSASVLLQAGKPVGLLKVVRTGAQWELVQVQLVPELQGRGLGTVLLQSLVAEARSHGAGLRLSVLKSNPAKRLYERLGFAVIEEKECSYEMAIAA
jgi:MOSC domain-containing protein YiiM